MRWLYLVAIWITVAAHAAICVANIAAAITLPLLQYDIPWYVWVPLETYVLNVIFQGCPVTKFENALRQAAGLPKIHSFAGHYFGVKQR